MSMTSLSSLSCPEQEPEPEPEPEKEIQQQDANNPGPKKKRIPDRANLFDKHHGEEFRIRYRISKNTVVKILDLIGDLDPMTQRNKSIDGITQLLICLRFYATGSLQQVISDIPNIHKSTICRIIQKVTLKIAKLRPRYIKMPADTNELRTVAQEFYEIAGFPHVLGVLDCTLIKIVSRGKKHNETFRGRKGYFAINVQVVCDAKLKIRDIVARWPGSVHDCTIFKNSHLCASFEIGKYQNYHFLGDSAYICKRFLLTPFFQPQSTAEEAYNRSHILTRNTVQRCLGMWKRRSPCLQKGVRLTKTDTILQVIIATAVLHNMCIDLEEEPPNDLIFEPDVDDLLPLPNWTLSDSSVRTAIVNTVFS